MTNDNLQFSISQYADGTLDDIERSSLESLLATNPEAQALLQGERELTDFLRAAPLPEVRWDRLAESISSAIDNQMEKRAARASWWLKLRAPVGLAAAASVLFASALAIHSLLIVTPGPGSHPHPGPVAIASPALVVDGPRADRPQGPVVMQISVSAGGEYAKEPSAAPYADEIEGQTSRVLIASGVSPEQTASVSLPF